MALLKTNTGIGTTNPQHALHVIGNTKIVGIITATTFSGDLSGDVTGAVGSVTGNVGGNVGGNVVGSVDSVTGAVGGSVGSVTGAVGGSVGSVTGAVGSVTGNVGGNVGGSVDSVTGAVGGSVASVTGNVGGSVDSVTGDVGGNVGGNVVGSVDSVTGNVGGSVDSVTGDVGGNVGGNVVGSVDSVTGAVGSVTGNVGGNVGGNVDGSVGSVTGNVGGNVTGNIEGNVLGNISFASTAGIATYTSQWDVVASTDNTAYEFTGPGNLNSTGNPTLFLTKGEQYKFNINADGHNFWIKTQTGIGIGNSYNTGVVGNGTTDTTITWDVPFDAPDILYYQCQNHTAMNGTINLTTGGGVGSSDNINTTGIITAGNFSTTGVSTASKFVSTTSNDKFLESSSGTISFYNISVSFTPTSTTPTAQIHTFPAADILAADYFILSEASISGTTYRQSEKVSIVHDGTTAYESEYAVTHTGNRLFSIETALAGGTVSVTYRSTSVGYSTQHSIKVLRIGMRT